MYGMTNRSMQVGNLATLALLDSLENNTNEKIHFQIHVYELYYRIVLVFVIDISIYNEVKLNHVTA